jgi:hypothetical protein
MFFLKLIFIFLLFGLFIYSKLLPYKDRLFPKQKKQFDFFDRILSPILNLLRRRMKPAQVGNGVALDMAQVFLFIILLFFILLFR